MKTAALTFVTAIAVSAGLMLFGVGSLSADSGGCPNEAAANGAAHANDRSAHGDLKQSDRACVPPTPAPTPEPTPIPAPAFPPADLQVMAVFMNAPSTSTMGVPFSISASANVRNNGTASTVMGDTTFTPTVPAGCVATPGAFIVQDRWFPINTNVFISRFWSVTCFAAGPHAFTMGVGVAIDPTQAFSDPNMANNSASGGGSTQTN